MGVEPYLINSSLLCVVAQRLVRKICPHCKEEYTIKKEVLESLKLNIDAKETKFFRGKGCGSCFNMGYAGRVGIAEVLVVTSAVRDLILSRAQEHFIKQKARQEGMRTLREDGLSQVFKGVTTLEEVLRVTAPDE
jgi:type IV pilus assembly protein PilB